MKKEITVTMLVEVDNPYTALEEIKKKLVEQGWDIKKLNMSMSHCF